MNRIFGYGCVASKSYTQSDAEDIETLQNIKAFRELYHILKPNAYYHQTREELLRIRESIIIEILPSRSSKRVRLLTLLAKLGYGDTLVICSLGTLGNSVKEIQTIYKEIYQKNISLLIYETDGKISPLSTVDENYQYIACFDEYNLEKKLQEIRRCYRPKNYRGRCPLVLDQNFIEAYWRYENYFVEEKYAYQNDLIWMSKNSFHKLCSIYESSRRYLEDQFEQEEQHCIRQKPKRHGTVPENFEMLMDYAEHGGNMDVVFESKDNPITSWIDYQRYVIKFQLGRSGMRQAGKQWLDEAINHTAAEAQKIKNCWNC